MVPFFQPIAKSGEGGLETLTRRIRLIQGQMVMLDSDDETSNLRSQIATSSYGGRRHPSSRNSSVRYPAKVRTSPKFSTSCGNSWLSRIPAAAALDSWQISDNPPHATIAARHCALGSPAAHARPWEGKTWTKSNHNLDRIVVKDSRPYGVEIKNTQNYISREELKIKLDLCRHLGLIPLFIVRFAPKSYIYEVQTQGGFTLLFEEQMYPFGQSALLSRVRSELGLKVHCPNDVKDGDIQRLLKWHDRQLRPR